MSMLGSTLPAGGVYGSCKTDPDYRTGGLQERLPFVLPRHAGREVGDEIAGGERVRGR